MAKPIPSDIPDDVKARFWAKVDVRGPDECWTWEGTTNSAGYGIFHFGGHKIMAHRMSLSIINSPSDGLICMHSCDNPPCVNPSHLSWGTDADNMRDMIMKGRKVVATKPNTAENRSIKIALISSDKSCRTLAKDFGMPRSLVYYILAGQKWRNVEPFIDPIHPLTTMESRGGRTHGNIRRGEHLK